MDRRGERANILEKCMDGAMKELKMIISESSNFGIMFKNMKRLQNKILYLKDKKDELDLFNPVRNVNEVNDHLSTD